MILRVVMPIVMVTGCYGQEKTVPAPGERDRVLETPAAQKEPKRLFGIIPNNRTAPTLANYQPLTAREKFKIATSDSFDPGTFVLAGLLAGKGQLTAMSPSFGQGVRGYAHYYGTSVADLIIGDYMTEAIYPSLLHQDPRYFRKGEGSGWSRLGYAVKQIVWTHHDGLRGEFNYSEFAGNATAVAIGNAYYPDSRHPGDAVGSLGLALGIDTVSNIIKEFAPDVARKLSRNK